MSEELEKIQERLEKEQAEKAKLKMPQSGRSVFELQKIRESKADEKDKN